MLKPVIGASLEPFLILTGSASSLSLSAIMESIGTKIRRNAKNAKKIAKNVLINMIVSNAMTSLCL